MPPACQFNQMAHRLTRASAGSQTSFFTAVTCALKQFMLVLMQAWVVWRQHAQVCFTLQVTSPVHCRGLPSMPVSIGPLKLLMHAIDDLIVDSKWAFAPPIVQVDCGQVLWQEQLDKGPRCCRHGHVIYSRQCSQPCLLKDQHSPSSTSSYHFDLFLYAFTGAFFAQGLTTAHPVVLYS
jgi:hypothetical protein